MTARLRKVWGWDAVLENLQFERFRAANQTATKEWTSQHGTRKHEKEEIQKEVWTKRDDHRHHAIDALVIASTQQGFIQRMNTLSSSEVRDEMLKEIKANEAKKDITKDGKMFAQTDSSKKQYEEKKKFLDDYLFSKRPFTPKEVELQAEQILISFKSGKKVATTGVRKIKVDGKKKVVQSNIIIPRGALHEQFVYGKIKVVGKDFKTDSLIKYPIKYLFENVDSIAEPIIKKKVQERLSQFENDIKKAIDSLKKSPIYLDSQNTKLLLNAHCYKEEYVIKYKVGDLKKDDLKYIVDEKIKQIVRERLDKFNGKEKEAFKDILWLNEEKQIPIHTVRCFTGLSAVEAIKKNEEGKDIGFSIPGNNHHIAIYKNDENKSIQHICTFWHAVERKKYNIPYIIKNTRDIWSSIIEVELPQSFINKLPSDNLDLLFSLQQNEMFILGLAPAEVEEAIKQNNKVLLSKHLYLVWSISDNDYWFRHHLETKNSELKNLQGAKESNRYFRFKSVGAFIMKDPVKVRLNHLGEITKVGEL